MRSLKYGLMAAAALTAGMMIATPTLEAAQLSQPGTQVAQAKAKAPVKATAKRSSRRAVLDAREREVTKRLNQQQLQPR